VSTPTIQGGYKKWIAVSRRRKSEKLHFGISWKLDERRANSCIAGYWRVSWIEATGELYAKELMYRSDRFVVLGHFGTRDEVEARMKTRDNPEMPRDLHSWFGVEEVA